MLFVCRKYILVSLFTTLLTACGSSETDIVLSDPLLGIWSSNCYQTSYGRYYRNMMVFSETKFSWVGASYTDANCSISDFYGDSSIGSGTYSKGKAITTSSGLDAREIDMSILKEDFTDKQRMQYDIYRIDSNILYLGKTTSKLNRTTPETRPVELEFDVYYD